MKVNFGGLKMATANLGFEQKLWEMADQLRGSMDSGEYKNAYYRETTVEEIWLST